MPNRRRRVVVLLAALLLVSVPASTAEGAAADPPTGPTLVGPPADAPSPTGERPFAAQTTGVQPSGVAQVFVDQSRPNIVVIMADDMRADELRYMPRTRALLGRQGVRFDNAFSPHPLCCPARASFLSGKYTHNHGVWSNRGGYGGIQAFDDDSPALPTTLNRAGYDTAFLGKYLNRYASRPMPDGSDPRTYVPPGWTDWRAVADGVYDYYDATLNINGTLREAPGRYQTRLLGAQAVDVIDHQARSPDPFFLWASYVAPHVGGPPEKDDPEPVERVDGSTSYFRTPSVPREVRGMFDDTIRSAPGANGETDVSDKPYYIQNKAPADFTELPGLAEVARQRAEALAVLDQEVARTVRALARTGELDDSFVIFTADNGYFLGEHRIRQGKLLPYDPALRVPLLVRGPGIPAGQTRADPVLTIDFAPTFTALAGAAPDPSLDGASFLDLGRADPTSDTGWRRPIMTDTGPRRPGSVAVEGALPRGADPVRFTEGVRTRRYLYVEHATGERELYDLRRDPGQLDNIVASAGARPVVTAFEALIAELRECVGAQCRVPAPRLLQR